MRVSTCSEEELEVVRSAPVFRALTADRWHTLVSSCDHRVYERGEEIGEHAQAREMLLAVAAGHVAVSLLSPEGQELLLHVHGAGSVMLWECDCTDVPGATMYTSAEARTVVYAFATEEVVEGYPTNSQVMVELIALLRRELAEGRRSLSEQAFCTVRQRLARLLLQLGSGPDARIRYTREELARMIGTTREPATRVLSQLRDEGVIAYAPRVREIIVLDPARLRKQGAS